MNTRDLIVWGGAIFVLWYFAKKSATAADVTEYSEAGGAVDIWEGAGYAPYNPEGEPIIYDGIWT